MFTNMLIEALYVINWASLMALTVKNLLAMQETWIRSLGREDPLERGLAAHSNILAWRMPWTEKPGGYNPWGHKESDTAEVTWHSHMQAHAGLCC